MFMFCHFFLSIHRQKKTNKENVHCIMLRNLFARNVSIVKLFDLAYFRRKKKLWTICNFLLLLVFYSFDIINCWKMIHSIKNKYLDRQTRRKIRLFIYMCMRFSPLYFDSLTNDWTTSLDYNNSGSYECSGNGQCLLFECLYLSWFFFSRYIHMNIYELKLSFVLTNEFHIIQLDILFVILLNVIHFPR